MTDKIIVKQPASANANDINVNNVNIDWPPALVLPKTLPCFRLTAGMNCDCICRGNWYYGSPDRRWGWFESMHDALRDYSTTRWMYCCAIERCCSLCACLYDTDGPQGGAAMLSPPTCCYGAPTRWYCCYISRTRYCYVHVAAPPK